MEGRAVAGPQAAKACFFQDSSPKLSRLALHPEGDHLRHRVNGPQIYQSGGRKIVEAPACALTLTRDVVSVSVERTRCQPEGGGWGGGSRSQGTSKLTGQAWPRPGSSTAPALHHPALQPAVAKGRSPAGITCKRSRPSCQGRSGGRPLQEPPPAAVLPRRPQKGGLRVPLTAQSPMAALSTLAN